MLRLPILCLVAASAVTTQAQFYQSTPNQNEITDALRGDDPLWLTFRANAVAGSQGDDLDLPSHGHDPAEETYLQGADVGLNFRPNEYISGFANIFFFSTEGEEFGAESEEAFLKLNLDDYGLEFRGGRFLNRIGTQNAVHLHGWNFVDANLSTVAFLGEEGLVTNGGEINWGYKGEQGGILATVGFGEVNGHHEEEEDEHHDDEEDEDFEDIEEEEEHSDEEEGGFEGNALTARVLGYYNHTDFHQHEIGVNYATGDEDRELFGVDYTYRWRENGLNPGGRYFEVLGEYFNMDNGDENFNNFLLAANYGITEKLVLGGRYEFIEFANELEGLNGEDLDIIDDRQRFSVALTYTTPLWEDWLGNARVQYNYDRLDSGGDRSGAWFQLGLFYGPPEVR